MVFTPPTNPNNLRSQVAHQNGLQVPQPLPAPEQAYEGQSQRGLLRLGLASLGIGSPVSDLEKEAFRRGGPLALQFGAEDAILDRQAQINDQHQLAVQQHQQQFKNQLALAQDQREQQRLQFQIDRSQQGEPPDRQIKNVQRTVKDGKPVLVYSQGGEFKELALDGDFASDQFRAADAKTVKELEAKGFALQDEVEGLEGALALVNSGDIPFGPGASLELGARQALAKVGQVFGQEVDPSELQSLAQAEAFNTRITASVLDGLRSLGGSDTEKEFARIKNSTFGFGRTELGNRFILESAIALKNYQVEKNAYISRRVRAGEDPLEASKKFKELFPGKDVLLPLYNKYGLTSDETVPETPLLRQGVGTSLDPLAAADAIVGIK